MLKNLAVPRFSLQANSLICYIFLIKLNDLKIVVSRTVKKPEPWKKAVVRRTGEGTSSPSSHTIVRATQGTSGSEEDRTGPPNFSAGCGAKVAGKSAKLQETEIPMEQGYTVLKVIFPTAESKSSVKYH